MEDGASSSNSNGSSSRGGGGETVVIDQGRRKSSCGYCQSNRSSSNSHGLWANSLTAYDYQELLDHGWRRSGCYLYKPEMESTCCPSYTIRLKASDFRPSKEQDRVYRKMERFLDGTISMNGSEYSKKKLNSRKDLTKPVDKHSLMSVATSSAKEPSTSTYGKQCKEDEVLKTLQNKIDDAVNAFFGSEYSFIDQVPKAIVKRVTPQAKRKQMEIADDLLYTSSISFQIAATIRRFQSKENIGGEKKSKLSDVPSTIVAEKLAHLLEQHGDTSGMIIKACNGHLNFYSTANETNSKSISSNKKAQASEIVKDCTTRSCLTDANTVLPNKRKKLEIRTKKSSFDPEEFALYKKYQIQVHRDRPEKVSESSYKRFLVDTPIVFIPPESGNTIVPPCGFGSFHQQYWIDGKLVAVGVVDILPRCLSSKYLFWDPDLAFLSLGKYTALQEISWVKESEEHCPSLQYYYLGYYIHSCSKMRYKAAYRPSELLCPLRYKWVSFEIARPLLDKKVYVVLSDYPAFQSDALPPEIPDAVGQLGPNIHHVIPSGGSSDEDEELALDYADMDTSIENESESETSDASMVDDLSSSDVGAVMLDVNGLRVRFKELGQVFGPIQKSVQQELEKQLRRYVKVVGNELAGHMIYSLG